MKVMFKQWWPVWVYVIVTLVCSIIYWLVPCGMFTAPLDYPSAFYFSLVTGTTLGYGDIAPTHLITRSIAAIQALSSPVLLAFFVSKSLYQKQINDQEKEKQDKVVLLYAQLFSYLSHFLSNIQAPSNEMGHSLRFQNSSDHMDVSTGHYDESRSELALNNNVRLQMKYQLTQDRRMLDVHRSRLKTIYKPALTELTKDLAEYSSVNSMLPVSVTLTVGRMLRTASELSEDIDKDMSSILGIELTGESELQGNWEKNNLQRLKFIELETYELLANIEDKAKPIVRVLDEYGHEPT